MRSHYKIYEKRHAKTIKAIRIIEKVVEDVRGTRFSSFNLNHMSVSQLLGFLREGLIKCVP